MIALAPDLLLRVAATLPLPGLGLLAMPAAPAPLLLVYPLHTSLDVAAILPDGTRYPATATVEEITRGAVSERGLLLDFGTGVGLPIGSEIWLVQTPLSGLNE